MLNQPSLFLCFSTQRNNRWFASILFWESRPLKLHIRLRVPFTCNRGPCCLPCLMIWLALGQVTRFVWVKVWCSGPSGQEAQGTTRSRACTNLVGACFYAIGVDLTSAVEVLQWTVLSDDPLQLTRRRLDFQAICSCFGGISLAWRRWGSSNAACRLFWLIGRFGSGNGYSGGRRAGVGATGAAASGATAAVAWIFLSLCQFSELIV